MNYHVPNSPKKGCEEDQDLLLQCFDPANPPETKATLKGLLIQAPDWIVFSSPITSREFHRMEVG